LGAKGDPGADGAPGENGPAGPEGPQGEPGVRGPQGAAGDAGFPGYKGKAGAQGRKGRRGPRGAAGAQGAAGEKGPAGPQGPAGPTGVPGQRGNRGATGETGPQGPKGFGGANGAPGDPGDAGPVGYPGPCVGPFTKGPSDGGEPEPSPEEFEPSPPEERIPETNPFYQVFKYYSSEKVNDEKKVMEKLSDRELKFKEKLEVITEQVDKFTKDVEDGTSKQTEARTCFDLKSFNPELKSGYYYIDPNGGFMKMPSEFTVTSKTRTRSSLVFHQNTPRLYQKHTGNLRCTLEAQKNSSQQTMAWDLSNTSLIWNKWNTLDC